MLLPKRVKHRKQQRGRIHGEAHSGNAIAFGDYGLVSLEPHWITNRQIEAARIALNRYIKRGGKMWIRIFPESRIPRSRLKPAWVVESRVPSIGSQWSSRAQCCSSFPA